MVAPPATPAATARMTRLAVSLADAETLIQHAARTGKEIPTSVLPAIMALRAEMTAEQVQDQTEVDFWTQATLLSKTMLPATVEGIIETRPFKKTSCRALVSCFLGRDEDIPAAYASVSRYLVLAITILVVVVGTQVFAGYGAAVLGNLNSIAERRIEFEGKKATYSEDEIERRQSAFQDEEAANIALLQVFNVLTSPFFEVVAYVMKTGDIGGMKAEEPVQVIERARITIIALNGYLLPVLIGTLGAIAHILRSLAKQIGEDSYTSESRIQLRLRLVLGPLAGASIGLLFVGQSSAAAGGEGSVPGSLGFAFGPFALPFVAGYSVEFLFSIADRIIESVKTK